MPEENNSSALLMPNKGQHSVNLPIYIDIDIYIYPGEELQTAKAVKYRIILAKWKNERPSQLDVTLLILHW